MISLNEKSAELIGMHIGDGTLYRTPTLVWELRGSLDEKDYYFNNVKSLLESLFNLSFEPKFRSGGKNGCFGVQTSKKGVTQFFLDYGFQPGTKTYTIRIPQYIFEANWSIQIAFLRGLFDTDGCIRFERVNRRIRHEYPRVEMGFASRNLRDDLQKLISSLGFRCFVWSSRDEFKIYLSGNLQVERWFSLVNPSNTKHLNKYEFWREKGYYMPRSLNLV